MRERFHRSRIERPDQRFDRVADSAAALIIRSYSSSFWLASRLLPEGQRRDIHHIYALVRVADEIVDAPRADQQTDDRRRLLDDLAADTDNALRCGASANPVVHAFAGTARRTGIDATLVDPFFASMRTDLDQYIHDEGSLADYIHGSAEVIGLMCLRAFLADSDADDAPALGAESPYRRSDSRYQELAPAAARLGAGFQKVNFLRDLGADHGELGRAYLPGLDPLAPDALAWHRWLDEVDQDLAAGARAIPELPERARVAVCTAHDLFAELSARLRDTPVEVAATRRVRVSGPAKLRIVAAAIARGGAPRSANGPRR